MNQFKRKLTAFTAMLAFLSLSSAVYAATVGDVSGKTSNMDVKTNNARTDVDLVSGKKGDVGQVDWRTFSVGKGEHVNFGFSNVSQTIINRVLGGQTSGIYGKMTSSCAGGGACENYGATGKVLLINPAGVIFGNGSQVDINSFTVSTFDMQGARNLTDVDANRNATKAIKMVNGKANKISVEDYQNQVLNKVSATKEINGTNVNRGYVTLDSNYQDAFNAANNGQGISYDAEATKGIKLDGSTFTDFAKVDGQFDFDHEAAVNTNKSTALVSNNIEYKDSVIRTGSNNNFETNAAGLESYSNVKLITADGVTFTYLNNGYIQKHEVAANDLHPTLARTIAMDNSKLLKQDPTKESITAGKIDIIQSGAAKGSTPGIKIKDTIIKGVKMVNEESGDIKITADQDIDISKTRITTVNSVFEDENGNKYSTKDNYGGQVIIEGQKNVSIADSSINTKGSTEIKEISHESGSIRILGGDSGEGNVQITNSKLIADGHTKVRSKGKTTIDNSLLQANNSTNTAVEKDLTVIGFKGVDINNTDTTSKGNTKIVAGGETNGVLTGDVNITSNGNKTIAENDPNQPIMVAGGSMTIQGKNTTIDNVTLAYDKADGLKFYDPTKPQDDANYINNVTIKNGTAFSPLEKDGNIAADVTIETNGNLTFDNATAQRAAFGVYFERKDENGNVGYNLGQQYDLNDNGTVDSFDYKTVSNPEKQNAVNLNIKSTQGNVTVKGGSKINATNNLTADAAKNYTQSKSSMGAGNNVNVTAGNNAKVEHSKIAAGNEININAENDVTLIGQNPAIVPDASDELMTLLAAKNDVNINASNGNYTQDESNIASINGNVKIKADKGAANINVSTITAANDVEITADKDITFEAAPMPVDGGVDSTIITAGSDYEGYDANDQNDNIGSLKITSKSGSVNSNGLVSLASHDKDVNITAAKDVNIGGSIVQAENNATIKANEQVNLGHAWVVANNDAQITSTNGDIDITASKINAKDGNASIIADKGEVNIRHLPTGLEPITDSSTQESIVEAGNHVTVTADKNVNINGSNIIAGSDSEGFDANDTAGDGTGVIGDVNITSKKGSVNIKEQSKVLSQDKDVNISAYNTIKFGNEWENVDDNVNIDKSADITAKNNVNITSTNGNIEGEKTTMPIITYGNRLSFNAKENNIFTSQDSLKSVNVDYNAGGANLIYTQDDAQFVNSTFKAPNNFVESGSDVILNNLTINTPEGTNPKDVTTQIFANGNVTTDNVTNEDLTAKGGTYPQSVSVDRTGTAKTVLNVNKTKLKVTTETVKDSENPDNGSITLVLQNADNPNAGVELKAINVDNLDQDPEGGYFKEGYYKAGDHKWDENIDEHEGPEIHLSAIDDKIAIKDLYSDKLTLDSNDNKIADNTNGTPKITVLDQGGLSLDPDLEYDKDDDGNKIGDGFTYDQTIRFTDENTTGGELILPGWPTNWTLVSETQDPDGTIHRVYEKTRDGEVTERITVKMDREHKITFDNEGNPSKFILVYDKKDKTVVPGYTITAQQVKENESILDEIKIPDPENPENLIPATSDDFIKTKNEDQACEDPDDPGRDDMDEILDITNNLRITLPREQVEISKTSTVADNTADQTANIMSAAAKVDLSNDIEGSFDDDDEDDLD